MQSFSSRLSDTDIRAVAVYVVSGLSGHAAYHTASNGWPDHQRRYGAAYPFVRDEIPVDADKTSLTDEQKQGLALFQSACSSCHEGAGSKSDAGLFRMASDNDAPVAPPPPVKAPAASAADDPKPKKRRGGDCSRCHDGVDSSGKPLPGYHSSLRYVGREEGDDEDDEYGEYGPTTHDVVPDIAGLTEVEIRGRKLYQSACAFCHAADGTGQNWIGDFLTKSPIDFTDRSFAKNYSRDRFVESVLDAPENTSMPSFRNVLSRDDVDFVARYVERAFINKAGDR